MCKLVNEWRVSTEVVGDSGVCASLRLFLAAKALTEAFAPEICAFCFDICFNQEQAYVNVMERHRRKWGKHTFWSAIQLEDARDSFGLFFVIVTGLSREGIDRSY